MKMKRLAIFLIVLIFLAGVIFLAWRRPSIAGIQRRVDKVIGTAVAFASPPKADPTIQIAPVPFDLTIIDPDISGDVKLVGDIDGDGFPDLIIGGITNEKLNWYHYPDWQKTVIATPNNEFTTDGRLGDVNGDGSLDIVVPDGDGQDNLVWFENPRPSGDPFDGAAWTRHTIGTVGSWGKDVHVSDFDDNGLLDVATRRDTAVMVFFQMAPDSWTKMEFTNVDTGHEGMTSGDVDKDTHDDLVVQGQWVRNPGGDAARNPANWTPYDIGPANSDFKALVVDLNKDGHMDVLFSSSENTADVNWWSADGGDPTGTWTKHTIVASLERCHTLQAADMDNDGDMDVITAEIVHWHIGQSADPSELLLNDGAGSFTRPDAAEIGLKREWDITTWNEGDLYIAFADLDADGWKDIVLASSDYEDTRLFTWRQVSPGQFQEIGGTIGL
ncbi:MAG: VCBS repeat-containing protein, partial [Anaerolineales bacterium]|nr:VCBS repeat-containing protein [Anaerolineales bacterium]